MILNTETYKWTICKERETLEHSALNGMPSSDFSPQGKSHVKCWSTQSKLHFFFFGVCFLFFFLNLCFLSYWFGVFFAWCFVFFCGGVGAHEAGYVGRWSGRRKIWSEYSAKKKNLAFIFRIICMLWVKHYRKPDESAEEFPDHTIFSRLRN